MKKLLMLLVIAGLACGSATEKANAQFGTRDPKDLHTYSSKFSKLHKIIEEHAQKKFRKAQEYRTPYFSNGGHFLAGSSGTVLERDRSGKVTFTFRRLRTDDNFIYLRDDSRRLEIALPKTNGMAHIRVDGRDFTDFSPVTWRETEGMGL